MSEPKFKPGNYVRIVGYPLHRTIRTYHIGDVYKIKRAYKMFGDLWFYKLKGDGLDLIWSEDWLEPAKLKTKRESIEELL